MEDKYAAQTDFLSAESVNSFYRQIIMQGYLGDNLTQQIAEETYPEIVPEIQLELDLEPER